MRGIFGRGRYSTATLPMRCTSALPVFCGEAGEHGIARGAVPARGLHLDELVVVQGAGGLGGDRIGEPGLAHQDHRLQGVGEAAQVPALALA